MKFQKTKTDINEIKNQENIIEQQKVFKKGKVLT